MDKIEAENAFLEEFFQAMKGESVKQKKMEKALRVLEMERIKEIYKNLSDEFTRRGIASNRFSELEELVRVAENLKGDLEHVKKSDNLVIDSYELEVQELNCALVAASEIFKNLLTYCFITDSHWGVQINKWLKGYDEISQGGNSE